MQHFFLLARNHSYLVVLKLCFTLSTMLLALSGLSQSLSVKVNQWSFGNGLQSREINCLIQDPQGLMWLGSSEGLQRYDGHEFLNWNRSNTNSNIYGIKKMGIDNGGWLWLWNTELQEFTFIHSQTFQTLSQLQKFGDSLPISSQQKNGTWIYNQDRIQSNSKKELVFVLSEVNQIIYYNDQVGFRKIPISSLNGGSLLLKYVDSQDRLWVQESTEDQNHLHLISTQGQIIHSWSSPSFGEMKDFHESMGVTYFKSSNIQNNEDAFYQINDSTLVPKRLTIQAQKLIHTQDGFELALVDNKWRISEKNPKLKLRTSIDQKEYQHYLFQPNNELFEDQNGRIWIPSLQGLSMIQVSKNSFYNYWGDENQTYGQNSVRGICNHMGNTYVLLEKKGIFKIDANHNIDKVSNEDPFYGTTLFPLDSNQLLYGAKESLKVLDVSNGNSKTLLNLPRKTIIWSIYKNRDTILLGTSNGLFAWSPINKKAVQEPELHRVQVYYIGLMKESETTYLATSKGLVSKNGSKLKWFSSEENKTMPFKQCFHFLFQGNEVYLATDNGIIVWQKNNGIRKVINQSSGLSYNKVFRLAEDHMGRIWASTSYGLNVYYPGKDKIISFTEKDGIANNEFNRISSFQDQSGNLYFGGINGLTEIPFRAHLEHYFSYRNNLSISDISLILKDGSSYHKRQSIYTNNTIELPTNYQVLKVHLALPNYLNDHLNTYQWKDGESGTWNSGSGNIMQIAQLSYGKHTIYIRAKNKGGTWVMGKNSIQLNILKPYYLQAWFFGILGLIAFSGTYLYIQYRTQQYKKSQALLEDRIKEATLTIQENADRLKKMDEVKTQFFNNVSHELRTPLTLILSPLENILSKDNNSFSKKELSLLKLSYNNSQKLKSRVDELLDLAKLDSGNLILNEIPTHLNQIIQEVFNSFTPIAESKNIQYSLTNLESEYHVTLDQIKLEKVIYNLLSNAFKHCTSEDSIEVIIGKTESEEFEVNIKDSGPGINQESIPHLFNRFYQTETGAAIGGSGIGLAYSKNLARLMGGDLIYDTQYQNGASFKFRFKAKPASEITESKLEKRLNPSIESLVLDTSLNNLLIVDDETDIRTYIKSIVEGYFNIYEAGNGKQALDLLKTKKVDIILSDIMMPLMNGLELAKNVKHNPKLKHIPFLFLSAKSDKTDIAEALELGIDDYLTKPFYGRELIARLNNLSSKINNRKKSSTQEEEELDDKVNPNWLNQLNDLIDKEMPNHNLSVSDITNSLNLTERTLNRKLNHMVGLSCAAFIREKRLLKAFAILTNQNDLLIKEVAAQTGFKRQDYFAKAFYQRFGKQPSEFKE